MNKIMNSFGFLPIGVGLALFLLSQPGSAQAQGARAAIEAAEKKYVAAVNKGDAAAQAALYAEDAQVFQSDGPIVKGRKAIEQYWKQSPGYGIFKETDEILEIEVIGDWAHETGKYITTGPHGDRADDGKYIVIWKKLNGEWKIYREIWNSNLPKKV